MISTLGPTWFCIELNTNDPIQSEIDFNKPSTNDKPRFYILLHRKPKGSREIIRSTFWNRPNPFVSQDCLSPELVRNCTDWILSRKCIWHVFQLSNLSSNCARPSDLILINPTSIMCLCIRAQLSRLKEKSAQLQRVGHHLYP